MQQASKNKKEKEVKKPLRERLTDAFNALVAAEIPGLPTEAIFDEWLTKYKNKVFWVLVPDEEDKELSRGILFYRKPGRDDLNYAHTKRSREAHDEFYLAIEDSTYLGGSDELRKDEDVMITVCSILENSEYGAVVLVAGNL